MTSERETDREAAKQSGLEGSHGTELIGYIVIFERCEQVCVRGINARRNLGIRPFIHPKLYEKKRKIQQQKGETPAATAVCLQG